jgi:hypothetical protein
MKKLISLLALVLFLCGSVPAQIKVTFTLTNPRVENFYFVYDLNATIPAGQFWAVGSSNIRVNFTAFPNAGGLTVKADNPAINPNSNIHNANGYLAMTTTSVASGAAIGLNILTFNTSNFYRFQPGTYRLATIRWNRVDSTVRATMTFRVPPAQFPTTVFDSTLNITYNDKWSVINPPDSVVVSVMTFSGLVPTSYRLYQNYPNPFNPTSSIKFDIPRVSGVELIIYDVLGREVAVLVDQQLKPGTYEVAFDGTNLPSGVFFYKLEADDYVEVRKMVLIK